MKVIRIEFPQGEKLEGMVDVISEDFQFHYADLGSHHGLQCNYDNENIKYKLIMSFAKRIVESAKEIIKLNSEPEAQASVATKDDSSTSDDQQNNSSNSGEQQQLKNQEVEPGL